MLVFILALLIICAVAGVVVTAFAWPHLRAGSRVLTPRGERVVGRFGGRLRPFTNAVWPLLLPAVRPVARILARPARAAKRRLEPMLEPVIRAVEEGSVSRPPAPAQAPARHATAFSARPIPATSIPVTSTPATSIPVTPIPARPASAPSAQAESVGVPAASEAPPAEDGDPLAAPVPAEDRLEYIIQPFRPVLPRRTDRSSLSRRR